MFFFLKRLALFGGFLLLGLEIVFRTLVPAAEMPAGYQDPDYGIMALDRNHKLDGFNSMGRLGRPRFAWHVNNFGFNSFYDYKTPTERSSPCVVVIGNSYVQGLYSDADEHLAGRIQAAMGTAAEVYNLGTSGMPLSQCPRVVEFARDTFSPDMIIIQSGSGSVKGCLRENGPIPYCQQYVWKENNFQALPPSGFSINKRNRILRKSALVRYLYYNSNFDLGGQGLVQQASQVRKPAEAEAPISQTNPKLEWAVGLVLEEIRELVPSIPILIVFDADRSALYSAGKAPARLRNSPLVEKACIGNDVHFLDLTIPFSDEYLAQGRKFNFEENYHWNPYGVGIVAKAIMAKLEQENLFGNGRLLVGSTTTE